MLCVTMYQAGADTRLSQENAFAFELTMEEADRQPIRSIRDTGSAVRAERIYEASPARAAPA